MQAYPITAPVRDRGSGSLGQILVVDDEPSVRRFTVRVLEEEGYSVVEAGDGEEALELIRKRPGDFAVVVSDIVMPRLTGVDLLQAIARLRPSLPCLLMSGYAADALTARGIAAPCGVLRKPFPAERLVEEVRRCIESQRE